MALNKIHVALSKPSDKYLGIDLNFRYDTSKCGRCGRDIVDLDIIRLCAKCFNEVSEISPKSI